MCVEYCDNCTDEELCCSNGCGHVCTKSVVSETPCIQIRDDVMGSGLMGSYVPQCEEDGRFSAVQCHGSTGYCWCVAEDTGVPVSDMVRFGMPECSKCRAQVDRQTDRQTDRLIVCAVSLQEAICQSVM